MGDFAKEFEESEDIRVTADQIVDKTIKDAQAAQLAAAPAPEKQQPGIKGKNEWANREVESAIQAAYDNLQRAKQATQIPTEGDDDLKTDVVPQ